MKIHTVFVTYNRLELTKQAFDSYLDTVTVPYSFCFVDNGSTDGTQEWLKGRLRYMQKRLPENRYPGYATNLGWSWAPETATHLHRADNDFIFLPGWCEEVERMFEHIPTLGQLGLRTDEQEECSTNVGGNCVIRRELWEKGLRWDERPWPQIRDEVGPGWTEDSLMSGAVRKMGYYWTRVQRPCIHGIAFEDPDDSYYQESWAARGITSTGGAA